MDTSSSSNQNLARRLLQSIETANDIHFHDAAAAIEKLRITLSKFAGSDGFTSLLRRALALASAEMPSLHNVSVCADGRLENFEQLATDSNDEVAGSKAAIAIVTHLIELLITFIGESLTLRLLRETWPDTLLDEFNSKIETDR